MDKTIYTGFRGKMHKTCEPSGSPDSRNFVITHENRDWSNFRTLGECEAQFPELEAKHCVDNFAVVER